jgi:hypothetical protein
VTELTRYRERPDVIVDHPEAVLSFLRHLDARGELVSYEPTHPVIDNAGRVTVRYVRRELAPRAALPARAGHPAPARWSVRRRAAVAAAVVVPLALVAGLLLWWLWVHIVLVLGVTVAALLLTGWWGAGQVGVCPGLHCPGCKCGGR